MESFVLMRRHQPPQNVDSTLPLVRQHHQGGLEKKIFFRQNYRNSIKISYGKFRFDATSITPPKWGFPPPPSKAAPLGGCRKKKKISPNEAEC